MSCNIFTPRKTIRSVLENPSIVKALLIVLLSSIAGIVVGIATGFAFNAGLTIINIVLNYVHFFVAVIVFYVIARIIRGGEFQHSVKTVASAVSLMWIFALIFTLLWLAVPAFVPAEVMGTMQQISGSEMASADAQLAILNIVEQEEGGINFVGISGLAVVVILLTIFAFYFFYTLVSETIKLRIGSNILALLAILAGIGVIYQVLAFFGF